MNTSASAPVSPAEIAYAAALFMAAANRRLPGSPRLSLQQEICCRKVYQGLVSSPSWSRSPSQSRSPSPMGSGRDNPVAEVSLYAVFQQLWALHRTELAQEPICGRILAFHLLMEHTRGGAIRGWTSSPAGKEEEVVLHPAVIKAIGSARFSSSGGFAPGEFAAEVLLHAVPQ